MNIPIIFFNFKDYWKNPFVNKFVDGNDFEGILIFEKNKKPIWLSHPFNLEQAQKKFGKKIIVKELNNCSLKNLTKRKIIGYDSNYTTINQLKKIKKKLKSCKFLDCTKIIEKEREKKNLQEIKKISFAVKNTKKIIKKTKKILKNNITEKNVKKFVEKEFEKIGMQMNFCIIAFGKNTKNLHHVPTEKKLLTGPVLFDIGGKYQGYCSDISTSFWFGEKNNKNYLEYKKKLDIVNNTLTKIEKKLKPNIKSKKIFEIVKNLNLPHSLGHGIGLEEHDYPKNISNNSNWKLEENMVLAIEPGIYNKFGIRIEKNYLIKKNGFKEL